MFANNPKELEGYPLTGYWVEWVFPKKEKVVDETGTTITEIPGYYVEKPKMVRYKYADNIGEEKTDSKPFIGRGGTNAEFTFETRAKYPFKKEDLFLTSLELLPFGQTNRLGLRYANASKVLEVKDEIDEEMNTSNLMFKTGNEIIKKVKVG